MTCERPGSEVAMDVVAGMAVWVAMVVVGMRCVVMAATSGREAAWL